MGYVLLTFALVCNAVANIMLKIGAANFASLPQTGILRAVITNAPLVSGVGLFAINVVLYALALSRLPLSIAYPVMVAGGFLIVNGYALLFLHEHIGAFQLAGYVCILAGILLAVVRLS